ncbi:MAG: uncharacterized protein KVP18_002580 [Porospora cf. gigantea A]|uniref:uncharacterized protein n=1 Tax=Porospora cf. gigantea A TaxID=2853593 RepID=UPI00355A7D99|nr:MAG: hypothetical protein KVP18_002580 [Porospora cf. gigantea A]
MVEETCKSGACAPFLASSPDNFLTKFDFAAIDALDPSLDGESTLAYDREIPMEIRLQDDEAHGPQDVGSLEAVRVKILVNAGTMVRMEISSESDLFFHYAHIIDCKLFSDMQGTQKLMIDFADYPSVLMKMLNSCLRDPSAFVAVFLMLRDGTGRLDFIQNLEYKFVELLSVDLVQSCDETVRKALSYRYNALKSKMALMQARLLEINAIVKTRNPALLTQLHQASLRRCRS